jgi:hypothetical protein
LNVSPFEFSTVTAGICAVAATDIIRARLIKRVLMICQY